MGLVYDIAIELGRGHYVDFISKGVARRDSGDLTGRHWKPDTAGRL